MNCKQYLLTIGFLIMVFTLNGQVKCRFDTMTVEQAWEMVKNSDPDSMQYDFYSRRMDSVWEVINRPLTKEFERQNRRRDSLNKLKWDTIAFQFIFNGEKIRENTDIRIYFAGKYKNRYKYKETVVLDSSFVFPSAILNSSDSGIMIFQYKNMLFYSPARWSYIRGQYQIDWIVDMPPFHKKKNQKYIGDMEYEKAEKRKSEAILKILYYKTWTCRDVYIPELKEYYKKGEKYLRKRNKIRE